MSILESRALVLNRSYYPIGLCSLKDSFKLVCEDVADILDGDLNVYDFKTWCDLEVEEGMDSVGLVSKRIRAPRIIRLRDFNKVPERVVRFNKKNVYIRDQYVCQYCRQKLTAHRLSMDHVLPKSRGGKTTWNNIVASCMVCNSRKADKTPEEAGMKLHKQPTRPHWKDIHVRVPGQQMYKEWEAFADVLMPS